MASGVWGELGAGLTRWRTWWTLAIQDIELRYRRSLLGPFWISAALVAQILTLGFLFSQIFESEFLEYLSWLATGVLAWNLIATVVAESCNATIDHTTYLSNVPMPMTVPAGRVVLRNVIIFFHNLASVIIILLLFGAPMYPSAAFALVGLAVISYFAYCAVLVLGPICARFRDIPQLVQSLLQVAFFVTPIVWMPHQSRRPLIADGNPFYHLVQLIRAPLLGEYPTALNWTVALGLCAVMTVLAITSLAATRKRVALWV